MFKDVFETGKDLYIWYLADRIEKLMQMPESSWFGLPPGFSTAPVRGSAPDLTLEQAKQFLTVVIECMGQEHIQMLLKDAHGEQTKLTIRIITNIWPLLDQFGFTTDSAAMDQMKTAIQPHAADAQIIELAHKLESSVLFETGSIFGIYSTAE
eukprot:gnl/TRDRNA2_/TRDRNA2_39676_c1_seq1.p1 gnl/TRDRNA2_/TRDRNA2_39676_c1~~gnl/TRDRNA2_/TRDRNA2_39676_c1_seq1.p1  ORF type:complete len:153 (+),score=26.64 gnl/TRDRNA2_/TRDRNA2_39676_c1_seq1:2-460(+)